MCSSVSTYNSHSSNESSSTDINYESAGGDRTPCGTPVNESDIFMADTPLSSPKTANAIVTTQGRTGFCVRTFFK